MKKLIWILFILISSPAFAQYGINNGASGVGNLFGGINATATPAPTATPIPTATPQSTATPLTLPLSQVNGGLGIDYSSPSLLLHQTKDVGHAGANGGFAAQSFVRATTGAGQGTMAKITWQWIANDGTNVFTYGGEVLFACSQAVSGSTMSAGRDSGFAGTQTTVATATNAGAFNNGSVTFAVSTGTGTCDITIAGTITPGTSTSNIIYFEIWPMFGQGTFTAV